MPYCWAAKLTSQAAGALERCQYKAGKEEHAFKAYHPFGGGVGDAHVHDCVTKLENIGVTLRRLLTFRIQHSNGAYVAEVGS